MLSLLNGAFVEGVYVRVQEGAEEYIAGELNKAGLEAQVQFRRGLDEYLKAAVLWADGLVGSDGEVDHDEWPTGQLVTPASMELALGKGVAILLADRTNSLTLNRLVDWVQQNPQFVECCYEAAVKLNPTLVVAGYDTDWSEMVIPALASTVAA